MCSLGWPRTYGPPALTSFSKSYQPMPLQLASTDIADLSYWKLRDSGPTAGEPVWNLSRPSEWG